MLEKEIRIPKQQRSIEKKNKIKETAIELFSEKGYHNVSTNEIAKCAGLSIGTLYNYFTDKKSIYEELVGDLYTDILNQITPKRLSPDMPPVKLIEYYIKLTMTGHTYMTSFQKEITSLSQQYSDFRELEEKYRSFAVEKILTLLQEYKAFLRISDFSTAGFILHTTLEAVVHEVQFFPNSYNKETVINELTDMFCRYIFKDEYINNKSTSVNT